MYQHTLELEVLFEDHGVALLVSPILNAWFTESARWLNHHLQPPQLTNRQRGVHFPSHISEFALQIIQGKTLLQMGLEVSTAPTGRRHITPQWSAVVA